MATLHIQLLGDFRLVYGEEPVTSVNTPRLESLLTYLVLHREAPQPRHHLAFLLWPDSTEAQARNSLRNLLHRLRRALPDADCFLHADVNTLQWRPDAPFTLDVADFESTVAQADQAAQTGDQTAVRAALEEALALYRGDLLPSCYDDWIVPERERLYQMFTGALERLIQLLEGQRHYRTAIGYARRLLGHDPLREATYRRLMRLYALSGDRAGALRVYESCVEILGRELGVEPGPATREAYERLSMMDALPARRHNLPPQPTPFVGREEELAVISRLLEDPACRLLTLVGPPGIGKTRLALQAASVQVGAFLHGVYLARLAPLSSAEFLVSTIAESLNFSFHGPEDPKVQLLNYLREKEMLLLMDNFEHLLEGAHLLAEILRTAPAVKILVTSRERLNLRWEWLFDVEGLTYPDFEFRISDFGFDLAEDVNSKSETRNAVLSLSKDPKWSAVQLFLLTARRVRRRFPLSEEEPFVVRICQLVEGMPLGIELAAAWVRDFSCEEIARQIERNVDFLATSLRDMPERHRSVRAAFEHSWQLLSKTERLALAQSSVFRGGFSREAALVVTDATSLDLTSLVGKSLLRRTASGRYELHEMLRQFAAEKLEEVVMSGKTSEVSETSEVPLAVRDRHSVFYLGFVGQREAAINGIEPQKALAEIRGEIENVRQAWRWAVTQGRMEEIDRGLSGLASFYYLTGHFREGETVFAMAVDRVNGLIRKAETPERDRQIILGRLLVEQARLLNQLGMYERAIAVAQAAVRINSPGTSTRLSPFGAEASSGREAAGLAQTQWAVNPSTSPSTGSGQGSGQAPEAAGYVQWGRALYQQGDYKTAQTQFEQALILARNAQRCPEPFDELRACPELAEGTAPVEGLRQVEADSLRHLAGVFANRGDFTTSRAYDEQALRIYREIGDQRSEGRMLNQFGTVSYHQGDYAEARVYLEQALRIGREIGFRLLECLGLGNLGRVSADLGDYAGARAYFEQTVRISREIGYRRLEGLTLAHLGLLFHHLGDDEAAREHGQRALLIGRELSDRSTQAHALTYLGHTLVGLGRLAEAAAAYQEAQTLRREMGQPDLAMESLAGLAGVSLAQGDLTQAQAQVEQILGYLEAKTLQLAKEPFQVYLTCYRVLRANQDPRAQAILGTAYRLLQERAAKITDEKLRRSYLENVAAHREIVREWEKLSS